MKNRRYAYLASVVLVHWILLSSPAGASCLDRPGEQPDSPVTSLKTNEVVFVGTITQVSNDGGEQGRGRTASVNVDEVWKGGSLPSTVEVNGTAEPGTPGISTRDRFFKVGTKNVFFPMNDRSPFRDNACTATSEFSNDIEALRPNLPTTGFSAALAWRTGAVAISLGGISLLVVVRRRRVSAGRKLSGASGSG
jgi:hypothetical protein